jgi:hypothetical protein
MTISALIVSIDGSLTKHELIQARKLPGFSCINTNLSFACSDQAQLRTPNPWVRVWESQLL